MKCSNVLCLEPAARGDSWCRGCRYDFDVSQVMRKPSKRGGPFGGETGARASLEWTSISPVWSPVPLCVDPATKVRR